MRVMRLRLMLKPNANLTGRTQWPGLMRRSTALRLKFLLAAEVAMDDIEVVVYVRTDMVGSKVETTISFDRDEWESMSNKERDDACRDEMFKLISWGYEVKGS